MIGFVVLLIGLVLQTTFVKNLTSSALGYASFPLLVISDAVNRQGEISFASRASLAKQLRLREEQLADVAVQAAQWSSTETQRDQALALLAYHQETRLSSVTARVLLRERSGQDRVLIIDRGFASGIRAFDPVVTGSGLLVGVVTEVGSSSSRVSLLSNKDTRIGARVMGDAQTSGIIEGGQGPVLVLRYVSKEASMTVNTLIVTSGIDPQIPPDLVIGMVNAVEDDAHGSFSTVFIEPLADADRVSVVSVLTRPDL